MNKKTVYFDNAAATPLHPEVYKKMVPYLNEFYGNPSSVHSFGRKVRVAVEEARETIAGLINADAGEIYFVSGGTEAANFPIFGIARTEFLESERNRIVSSASEHLCVLEVLQELSRQGFEIIYADNESDSRISLFSLSNLVNNKTSLVSVMHINNETGAVNSLSPISEICREKGAIFHSDTVQSFGKVKIDVKASGADSFSFSSHKINGPKGAGAVFARSGTPLSPLIFGGSQERNRRGGTENPASIIGFAEAAKIAHLNMEENFGKVTEVRKRLFEGLMNIDSKGIIINGGDHVLPYILSVTFRSDFYNNDAEAILMYLDIHGIAASNGAACSSGTLKPSHVILSMGLKPEDAQGTIRFSFGGQNTVEEADYVLIILEKMLKKFRK